MKKIIVLLFVAVTICAEAQVQTPAASPAATLTTSIGLTDVKISYFRPRLKGRKIFGTGKEYLEQYGVRWRTGANSGTVITFGDDVVVEGKNVPKGEYLLLTTPGATDWTVVLYKDVAMGADFTKYSEANEAAKFVVKAEKLTEKVEMLTFNVTDLTDDNTSAKIQLAWDNVSVKFGVKVEFDSKVMKSIEASTKVNPNAAATAARYYYDNKKDLKKALEWIDYSISQNPDFYWNIHLKAQIQKALGDKAGATATANKSSELAKKDGNDFYVKQNEELIKTLK